MNICRWVLDCTSEATVSVEHTTYGTVEACAEHAAEHLRWQERKAFVLNATEPDPDCWCPDDPPETIAEYCPSHGTPAARGIDPLL
jgi:hypothetical protein